jgi:hypothetical protein
MNIKSKITLALIALGVVSIASADNVVYLTGSTAFRSTVYTALHTPGNVFDGAVTQATRGGSLGGANYMLFHGNISGTPTYINCAWSGSEAGIASAAGVSIQNTDRNGNPIPLAGSPETWLKADGSVAMTDTTTSPTTAELETSSHQSDLAMADTSQAVSLTPYVANTSTALKDYGTVGIVTFTFAKNVNTTPSAEWTAMNNISLPQANVLFSAGYQHTAFFTGISSQTNNYVYLVGRNKGSGTRANQLSDTGYGTTTPVQQFSIGGGVQPGDPTTGLVLQYEANNGYESGGGVAAALGIDGSCQQTDPFFPSQPGWFAVGMLGVSDALSHGLAISPNWLTFEGVAESDGAIEEGQYQLWGHEHVLGRSNISGYQDTVGGKLFTGVQTAIGTSGSNPAAHSPGIALNYMHCTKSSDTAYPTRNAGY